MSEILNRFSLDAAKFNNEMLVCLILVWLVVLGTAVSSIMSQPFTRKQRGFWLLVVIAAPVLGMLAYLPFSTSPGKNTASFNFGSRK